MYAELKSKGLELIAINNGDSKDRINQYVKEGSFTFPIGMGGPRNTKDYQVFENYGVQAYPTNYVIGPDGKVVFRTIGFNEKGIREALAKLGVKSKE
jgi:hypothetical protein